MFAIYFMTKKQKTSTRGIFLVEKNHTPFQVTYAHVPSIITSKLNREKLVPWGTDGRLPLIGDFRSLILEYDLDLDLGSAIRHTVMHHSSTSTYIPNFIEIGRKFFLKVTTEVLVKFRVT